MKKTRALKAAFLPSLPILAGFLFLGITYGIYMRSQGFSFWYPFSMSLFVFAGSVEFVLVSLLQGAYAPLSVLLLTLMINARHMFYSISMLEKYEATGWKKFYLIYGLCDESFSINYAANIPEDVDPGWFYFFVTLLNHLYWVGGASIGAFLGNHLYLPTEGLEFVLTALLVVIFLEQWFKEEDHCLSLLGLGVTSLSLLLLGKEFFILGAMVILFLLLLIAWRKQWTPSKK